MSIIYGVRQSTLPNISQHKLCPSILKWVLCVEELSSASGICQPLAQEFKDNSRCNMAGFANEI
jgi:hypothetical protein